MANAITNEIITKVKNNNKFSRLDYMKSNINLASIGIATSINFLSSLGDIRLELTACGLSLTLIASLIAQYFQYYDTFEKKCLDEYMAKVKKLPEYKDAINNYESFIRNLVKYFSYLGLNNPLDICFYSQQLLKKGFFSVNHTHKYYDYTNSYPCDYSLLGGRVFTGTSVCRHMAMLFNDILNETGALVTPLMVKAYEEKELPKIPVFIKQKPNHLIIGFRQDGKNIAYDPTNGAVATCDVNDKYALSSGRMLKSLTNDSYYLVSKKQDEELMGQASDIYEEYLTSNYYHLTKEAVLRRKQRILHLFNQSRLNNEDFYNQEYDRIQAIANYQQILCPQKNGKEFRW